MRTRKYTHTTTSTILITDNDDNHNIQTGRFMIQTVFIESRWKKGLTLNKAQQATDKKGTAVGKTRQAG